MTRPFIRVVKVGGSLLDGPDMPRALHQWLAAQPPAVNVLLAGGGPFADLIRQADRRYSLGEEQSHWLAVHCLSVTARLLAAIVKDNLFIRSFPVLLAESMGPETPTIVFDPEEFLRLHEAKVNGQALPHNWKATSDSVAARLAKVILADELVLLKSSDPPAGTLADLAGASYVDAHFPLACRDLDPPRFVNLRVTLDHHNSATTEKRHPLP